MERLQQINGDAVLEVTHEVTRRLSEKALLRQKAQLEESIAAFERRLTEVNEDLAKIAQAKDAEAQ